MCAYILNTGFFMTREGSFLSFAFRIGMSALYIFLSYLIIKSAMFNYRLLRRNEKFAQNQLSELEEEVSSDSSTNNLNNNFRNDPLISRIKDVVVCMR